MNQVIRFPVKHGKSGEVDPTLMLQPEENSTLHTGIPGEIVKLWRIYMCNKFSSELQIYIIEVTLRSVTNGTAESTPI